MHRKLSRRDFIKYSALSICSLYATIQNGLCYDENAMENIKVSILYTNLNDHIPENRTLEDAIKIVADLNPDFIWMMYEKGIKCPAESENTAYEQAYEALISVGVSDTKAKRIASEYAEKVKRYGYYFENWERQTVELKKVLPNIIVCSAIFTQGIPYWGWNFETLKPYTADEIKSMALDLSDYGLSDWNFEKTQKFFQKFTGFKAYFPDYCNEEYQNWLLSCVKRMKDCSADAVWLDMFFSQSTLTYRYIVKDFKHPAVRKPFEACCQIIEEIKQKFNMLVGSWAGSYVLLHLGADKYGYPIPDFDFITENPDPKEVISMKFDEKKWNTIFTSIRKYNPNCIILITPDWGPWDNTMLAVFSQKLTPEQQRAFLRIWNEFALKNNAVPCFPVHGGSLGPHAKKLAWGKYNKYDALAPEFNTYEIIKELIHMDKGITYEQPKQTVRKVYHRRIPCFSGVLSVTGLILALLLIREKKKQ